jgi:hypothetical protein
MHAVTARGRWIWGLSGLATVVALTVPGAQLITFSRSGQDVRPQPAVTRVFTVPQPVTSLNVQSYGMPVQVTAGPVRQVKVTETIQYDPGTGLPDVTRTVSHGNLTLADPACNVEDCGVAFTVTVPADVAVTVATEGAPVQVSGTAATSLDSGGAPVQATAIHGPLTINAEGGDVLLNGLTGQLHVDTGGGNLWAQGIDAQTTTVITTGGDSRIRFTAPVDTLIVSTDGGAATMSVPGGPYALTTDSDGNSETLGIPVNAAAHRSITVTTGGGPLVIAASPDGLKGDPNVNPPPPPPPPLSPKIPPPPGK